MNPEVTKKYFLLFLFVSSFTALTLGIGWFIGSVAGGVNDGVFGLVGGMFGTAIGGEIAYRRGLIEAEWGRIVWVGPYVGFGIVGGLASINELPGILMVVAAIIGSGLGAIVAKYVMEFFNEDPPPSIL